MHLEKLKAITEAFGPAGFEEDVVTAIHRHCAAYDVTVDAMNNLYVALKGNTGNKPVLMLDAHLDEVGFMVQSINANGLIQIAPLGGWVASNVPAHTVGIKTNKGNLVKGIVVSKPPHFMSESEKKATLDVNQLLIDVGCTNRDEVISAFGIAVGDPIAPLVNFEYNADTGICFGKAFDNRMGCVAILETLERLSQIPDLPFDVIGAFATQEEVGTRGAYVTAQRVKADLAIVFEGSPADDLYFDTYTAQCKLKGGTQIRHMDASYVSHKRLINAAKKLADAAGIPYQSAVRRQGSTNAGRIHMQEKAVPVLVLGIPSRYVHTHYNYAALSDLEASVNLAVEVAKHLSPSALTMRL